MAIHENLSKEFFLNISPNMKVLWAGKIKPFAGGNAYALSLKMLL